MLYVTLKERPHISQYIRKLVVRPNHPSGWADLTSEKHLHEVGFAVEIEKLVRDGRLRNLTAFGWEGSEAPMDGLWLALRSW